MVGVCGPLLFAASEYFTVPLPVPEIPEVTEIYRMSGDVDYLMRIVVPDIDAYDVVYKRLISSVAFLDVSASFALETIKYTTALPLSYMKLA